MPEDYNSAQGYGGYPQQPMQQGMPQQQMPQQGMPGQQPYGYGQAPMGANQYGYPGGQPPKQGLGTGAIIGIVAGVVAILAILGFFLLGPALIAGGDDDTGDDPTVTTRPTGDEDEPAESGTSERETADPESEVTDPTEVESGTGTDQQATGATTAPTGSQPGTTADASGLSDDWTNMEVNLAGKKYRLFESTYGDLVAGGWMLDEYDMQKLSQNGGSLILNAGEWKTLTLENSAYPDESLTIGLGNLGSTPINYDQATLVHLSARAPISDGKYAYDKTYGFVVSKEATFGLTDADILAKFGTPDDNGSVYEDASSGYKSLSYAVIGEGEAFNRNYYRLEFQFNRDDDGQYRVMSITIGV